MGYTDIFDFYEFQQTLGKGQYGVVKLALHKSTKQKVAIKIVSKKDMKPLEMYQ